jgi:hypothetical protein
MSDLRKHGPVSCLKRHFWAQGYELHRIIDWALIGFLSSQPSGSTILGGTILFHEIGLIEQPNKTLRHSSCLELLVRA